jgi:hypothetical protein
MEITMSSTLVSGERATRIPAKHHWSQWYAAYLVARERGKTTDEAIKEAALHMKGVQA